MRIVLAVVTLAALCVAWAVYGKCGCNLCKRARQ